MTVAPVKEKRKEEKDNIFLEILYNVLVQLPVLVIGWIITQFTSDR
jgi:hypothetical protein